MLVVIQNGIRHSGRIKRKHKKRNFSVISWLKHRLPLSPIGSTAVVCVGCGSLWHSIIPSWSSSEEAYAATVDGVSSRQYGTANYEKRLN